ncbi:MAG: YqgE/AlgH family protein [Terrimicrobiaceae bacterium]|nr:YqgE/AlgH family protein [Terrimicrobiaceae bacterium]
MSEENLTGSLLVAHPSLRDPNFRRTILFLSHHTPDEGATGFVLNRPLEEAFPLVPGSPEVPICYGGPVEPSTIILASLQWRENPTAVAFRTFVGRLGEEAVEPEWRQGLRAFAGYSGWSRGQLEGEIAEEAWLVIPPTRDLIRMESPQTAWLEIMRQSSPHLQLLAEAPDEPWLN